MTNNEKAMKNIREAAELIASLASAPHPAPDATDWKALCGAAVMERNAAQAENEKLRELLSQTVPFIQSAACDEDDYFVAEQREDLLREVVAALSPPPLSPEPAHD